MDKAVLHQNLWKEIRLGKLYQQITDVETDMRNLHRQ